MKKEIKWLCKEGGWFISDEPHNFSIEIQDDGWLLCDCGKHPEEHIGPFKYLKDAKAVAQKRVNVVIRDPTGFERWWKENNNGRGNEFKHVARTAWNASSKRFK